MRFITGKIKRSNYSHKTSSSKRAVFLSCGRSMNKNWQNRMGTPSENHPFSPHHDKPLNKLPSDRIPCAFSSALSATLLHIFTLPLPAAAAPRRRLVDAPRHATRGASVRRGWSRAVQHGHRSRRSERVSPTAPPRGFTGTPRATPRAAESAIKTQ